MFFCFFPANNNLVFDYNYDNYLAVVSLFQNFISQVLASCQSVFENVILSKK